jgi:hypothetical protein
MRQLAKLVVHRKQFMIQIDVFAQHQAHCHTAIRMESYVRQTRLEPAYASLACCSTQDGTGKYICYNVLCATEFARTPGSTIIVPRAKNHHPMCCCLCGSTAILMSRHITTTSVNSATHRCSKGTINPFDTRLDHYWSQCCRVWQRSGCIPNPHIANLPINHAHPSLLSC